MTEIRTFLELALQNAMRCALSIAEFTPIIDGALVAIAPNGVVGARIFFEPPVKCVWVTASGECSYGDYDTNRKVQTPLTSTFYFIRDIARIDDIEVFRNP